NREAEKFQKSGFPALWNHRQGAKADAGGVEQGVANGRGHGHDGSLTGAGRRDVFAVEKYRFDFRHVGKARNAKARKTGVENTAVFEFDGFEQRAPETLDHGADHLVAETIRIHNGATFKGFHEANHSDRTGRSIDGDFRTRGDIAALFVADRQSKALARVRFLPRPAEGLRGRFENVSQALLFQILPSKFERVHVPAVSQIIHVGLAGEVIGRGGKTAVGAAAQDRRIDGMKFGAL